MKNKKRGLNNIITSLLLVVIGFVAVVLVWNVVKINVSTAGEETQSGLDKFIETLFGEKVVEPTQEEEAQQQQETAGQVEGGVSGLGEEETVTLEGTSEVLHADDFENNIAYFWYYIRTDDGNNIRGDGCYSCARERSSPICGDCDPRGLICRICNIFAV